MFAVERSPLLPAACAGEHGGRHVLVDQDAAELDWAATGKGPLARALPKT